MCKYFVWNDEPASDDVSECAVCIEKRGFTFVVDQIVDEVDTKSFK